MTVTHALFVLLTAVASAAAQAPEFEPNRGQGPAEADFLVRHGSSHVLIGGVGMETRGPDGSSVRLEWLGASEGRWVPAGPTGNTVAYYVGAQLPIGREPIPTYRQVRRVIYPGIEWVLYVDASGRLEYDLVVQPGADPSLLRFRLTDASVESNGDLVAPGTRHRAPKTYQGSVAVGSAFAPLADGSFTIRVGHYDRTRPLVIDPVVENTAVVGGDQDDRIAYVAQAQIVGTTYSASWSGRTGRSTSDIFIRTESATGTQTIFFGGSGNDVAIAATSASFGLAITGWTDSRDIPENAFLTPQRGYGGGATDAFILRVSSFLPTPTFGYIGGPGADRGLGIAGDLQGNFLVGGETDSPVWPGFQMSVRGGSGGLDAFVWRADGALSTEGLILGGAGDDRVTAVVSTRTGQWVVAGETGSPDFPLLNPDQSTRGGPSDLFVAAVQSGSTLELGSSSLWGGSGTERAGGLTLWNSQVVLAGTTESADFPLRGVPNANLSGPSDGVLVVWNPTTERVQRSTYWGGDGEDEILSVATSAYDLVLAGWTTSGNLPAPGAVQAVPGGGRDGFVAVTDVVGHTSWATYWGGAQDDAVTAVTVLPSGVLRAGGVSNSKDWLAALGSPGLGAQDVFAAQFLAARLSAPDLLVGRDLQTGLDLVAVHEPESNGIITVTSSDPSRVVLARHATAESASALTLVNLGRPGANIGGALTVRALDSSGEVDLIVSGQHYPTRRVRVRLGQSVLVADDIKRIEVPLASPFTLRYSTAVLDPDTGRVFAKQAIRSGLDQVIRLRSSDPAGLSVNDDGSSSMLWGQRTGTYTVTASAPLFPMATGEQATVTVDDPQLPRVRASQIFLAREGRTFLTIGGRPGQTFRLTSQDPTRVRLAIPNAGTGVATGPAQASVIVAMGANSAQSVFVDAVGTPGRGDVRVEGPDGFLQTVTIEVAPLEISLTRNVADPLSERSSGSFQLSLRPLGAAPEGFITPIQWVRPEAAFFSPGPRISNREAISAPFRTFTGAAWSFQFLGLRAGAVSIDFIWPEHAYVVGSGHFTFLVRAPAVEFSTTEINVTPGFTREAPLRWILPAEAQVDLRLADLSVAEFAFFPGESTLRAGRTGFSLVGKGQAGQTTTLTVNYQGAELARIPVRVSTVVWEPVWNEIRVSGRGALDFRARLVDQTTGAQLPDLLAPLSSTQPAIVWRAEPPGICRLAEDRLTRSGPAGFTVPVECVAEGEANLSIAVPGPAPVWSAPVRVVSRGGGAPGASQPPTPFPLRLFAGRGVRVQVENLFGEYTATSLQPDRLLLARSSESDAAEVLRGSGPLYLAGLANDGTARLRIESQAYGNFEFTVHLLPPVLTFADSAQERLVMLPPLNQEQTAIFPAFLSLLDPFSGVMVQAGQVLLDPSIGLLQLRGSSTAPSVLEPAPPNPILSPGQTLAELRFSIRGEGTAELSLSQPPGFALAQPLRVRVARGRLSIEGPPLRVGKDLEVFLSGLRAPGGFPNTMTITSLDPARLLVSASQSGTPGAASATGPGQFFLHGLADEGTVQIRLQAPGLEDALATVQLYPAGLSVNQTKVELAAGGAAFLSLSPGIRLPSGNIESGSYRVRPGFAGFRVSASVADAGIVRVNGPQEFILSSNSLAGVTLEALRPGRTRLEWLVPAELSMNASAVEVLVRPWDFTLSSFSSLMVRHLLSTGALAVPQRNGPAVQASIEWQGTAGVLTSLDPAQPGQASLSATVEPSAPRLLYFEPAGAGNTASLSVRAEDFTTLTATAFVRNPEAFLNERGPLVRDLSTGTMALTASLGIDNLPMPLGHMRGPVRVLLSSSNPQVARPTVESVEFQPGDSSKPVTVQLTGRGDAVITLEGPEGFNLPTGRRSLLVTVR